MSFLVPKLPNVAQPTSPLVSVQAAQARQDAADAASRSATQGGRASTIHAGNDIAYGAGVPLLKSKGGASKTMGY